MTGLQSLELIAGIALLVGGGYVYFRRSAGQKYGSQSGVFLLIIGALVTMHALGLFKYRPSQGEIDRQQLQGAGQ
jgi:hypothetical protein